MEKLELQVAAKLQEYPENRLTKEIIIPLLEKIGYHRVEFFGGPSEEGKDIVFWDVNRMGKVELKLAQVKHFKFTNRAADDQSLMNVVNQIVQCFSHSLPYVDNNIFYRPNEVFVISTFPLDTKTLLTRFSSFPHLRDQAITIIDGIELSQYVIKHKPELIQSLLGLNIDIINRITPTLNNKILLAALGFHENKDLKTIYTDIDFSLGKRSTKLLFKTKFKPVKKDLDLSNAELVEFIAVLNKIKDVYDLKFITNGVQALEKMLPSISDQKKDSLRLNKLKKSTQIDLEVYESTKAVYNQKKIELNELERKDKDYKNNKSWQEFRDVIENDWSKVVAAERKLKISREQLNNEAHRGKNLIHRVAINGLELSKQIESKRAWIETAVQQFNTNRPTITELKDFILKCSKIINLSGEIFDNLRFFYAIGIEESKINRYDLENTRFELSTQNLFDTGMNFLVLGDAGAGKTTSLQMYVYQRQQLEDKLILWIPLGRIVQNVNQLTFTDKTRQVNNFIKLIGEYLIDLGVTINVNQFFSIVQTGKIILLLDGLDEAIKPAPWLPEVIANMAIEFKSNIQFIVTSRSSGDYINRVPFFAVTLLPFTDEQRERFIIQWFEGEENGDAINKIKRHLNKNPAIKEVITNPLLATTLCIIAKHNLQLPRTEVNLYNERIKLLTGHYDNVKKIASRISVPPHILELLAQKIAYYLHLQNKREEQMAVLYADINKITQGEIDKQQAKTALQELYDPCNLLVPMTDEAKLGFGHLRYQEHLAAKELIHIRADVKPLLKHFWWRGVLVLFAHMNNNLEWLIREVSDLEKCYEYQSVLKEMIATRSLQEQRNLTHLLDNYILLEIGETGRQVFHPDLDDELLEGFDGYFENL